MSDEKPNTESGIFEDIPDDISAFTFKDIQHLRYNFLNGKKQGEQIKAYHLKEKILEDICHSLIKVLQGSDNVLYLDAPITVCGDIHGQLLDLFQLFDKGPEKDNFVIYKEGDDGKIEEIPNPNCRYLFMGDYVDRGYCSLETFAYLALLKIKYPDNIFLLRGNHESRQINQVYGLFNDCLQLYGHAGIWFLLNDVFDLLPIAAVVDGRIFCVHGGLTPKFNSIDKIQTINRKKEIEDGPIADLTWSDPDNVQNFVPNRRGNGFIFGTQQTKAFCEFNKIDFVARSHQLANDGFQWFHDNKLVIVWSAPNYMYKSGNKASIMIVPGKDKWDEYVSNKDEKYDTIEDADDKKVIFREFLKHDNSHIKPDDLVIEYFA